MDLVIVVRIDCDRVVQLYFKRRYNALISVCGEQRYCSTVKNKTRRAHKSQGILSVSIVTNDKKLSTREPCASMHYFRGSLLPSVIGRELHHHDVRIPYRVETNEKKKMFSTRFFVRTKKHSSNNSNFLDFFLL